MPDAPETTNANGAAPDVNAALDADIANFFGTGDLPPLPPVIPSMAPQPEVEATEVQVKPEAEVQVKPEDAPSPDVEVEGEPDEWMALDMDAPTTYELSEDGSKVKVADGAEVPLQELVDGHVRGTPDITATQTWQDAMKELEPIRQTYVKEAQISESLRTDLYNYIDQNLMYFAPDPAYENSDDADDREWYKGRKEAFDIFRGQIAAYFNELGENVKVGEELGKKEDKFNRSTYQTRLLSKYPRLRGNKGLQRQFMAAADEGRKAVNIDDATWKVLRQSPEITEAMYLAALGKKALVEKRTARSQALKAGPKAAGGKPRTGGAAPKPSTDIVQQVHDDFWSGHVPGAVRQ